MDEGSEHSFLKLIKSMFKKKSHLDNSDELMEEIHDLMDEGQAKGLISDDESHMVTGALELREIEAHSIMIPRTEICAVPLETTLDNVIKLVNECGHTRIPIYKDRIDEIVGILHAKDLLKLWGKNSDYKIHEGILRSPYYVSENQMVGELLKKLKEQKHHMAVVTDEYGGTAGIITIEDILEVIVGDIMDEHDSEDILPRVQDDGYVFVNARLEIEKLEEYLKIEFPRGEFESVGGFIIHLLGRIPKKNEKVIYEGLEMEIKKVNHRKIDHVLISPTKQTKPV